jgi:hypothetical protein
LGLLKITTLRPIFPSKTCKPQASFQIFWSLSNCFRGWYGGIQTLFARLHNYTSSVSCLLIEESHWSSNTDQSHHSSFFDELLWPDKVLQTRVLNTLDGARTQLQVKWSAWLEELATWEDEELIKKRFPSALAWGQAESQGGENVNE